MFSLEPTQTLKERLQGKPPLEGRCCLQQLVIHNDIERTYMALRRLVLGLAPRQLVPHELRFSMERFGMAGSNPGKESGGFGSH